MQTDKLVSIADVLAIIPISRPTLWRYRSKGLFPSPAVDLPGRTLFRESDVQAFISGTYQRVDGGAQ